MNSNNSFKGSPTFNQEGGNARRAIPYKNSLAKEGKYNITVKGVIAILIVDVVVAAANVALFYPDKYDKAVKWLKGLCKHKIEEK